jgi:acyl-CoA thioester hydrolase
MPAVYEHHHTVLDAEIDGLGHANNVVYLHWMIDAAVAHSAAQGWNGERYQEMGTGWVVRRHEIDYLQPAYAGEEIIVRTWVADMRRVQSRRRFVIQRVQDGVKLAEATTNWAFINFQTGAPARIPAEVTDSFEIVAAD